MQSILSEADVAQLRAECSCGLMPFSRRLILLLLLFALPGLIHAAPKSRRRSSGGSGSVNVLFIVASDLRDFVGWMGGHPQAQTPNMDRLAKRGMRFTNAHCNYALCNPSRTSLLTGMLPSSSGVFGREQDWQRSAQVTAKPTLPEHFKSMGYTTSAGGEIFHVNHDANEDLLASWAGDRRGFDQDVAWDTRYEGTGMQFTDLQAHTGQKSESLNLWRWSDVEVPDEFTDDGVMTSWASELLRKKSSKPFFLALGLGRPHQMARVPKKYFEMFPLADIQMPLVKEDDLADVPETARSQVKSASHEGGTAQQGHGKETVQAYLAGVAFCDAMLGRVIDALDAGSNAKNTIVVFTSDHGCHLGEKQLWQEGMLWEEATRVPLTIYAPGITREDGVSAQPVSLVDLYPTLCDLTKVAKPEHLDGLSFEPLLRDPAALIKRPAITALGGGDRVSYAARTEQWRYIRYADGSEELYDHQADPHEWVNLASKPEHSALKQDLAAFFPKEFLSASRTVDQIAAAPGADGGVHLKLEIGDKLEAAQAPPLTGRGFFIEASFDFNARTDQNSTLVYQGDEKLGYALHLLAGRPTLTVFADGKATSVHGDRLANGRCQVRAGMDADGLMSLAVPGMSEMLGLAPFPNGFTGEPKTGLAAGQSLSLPGLKEYAGSTPFNGAVHRLLITLLPPKEQATKPATN